MLTVNDQAISDLQKRIDSIHDRVYNGIAKEIRQEVKQEIDGVRKLTIGILIAVLISLAGIVVEGRFSSVQASMENTKNYEAILDIGSKLQNHIITTEPRK